MSCLTDVIVSGVEQQGGIVIVVGQDEYDAIDADDQVTPELITSHWQVSADVGVDHSVIQSVGRLEIFGLLTFGFRIAEGCSKHPRASCPPWHCKQAGRQRR